MDWSSSGQRNRLLRWVWRVRVALWGAPCRLVATSARVTRGPLVAGSGRQQAQARRPRLLQRFGVAVELGEQARAQPQRIERARRRQRLDRGERAVLEPVRDALRKACYD